MIEDEIGDDVAGGERSLEHVAREIAPILREREIFRFEGVEIGGDFGEGEPAFEGREMLRRARQAARRRKRRVERLQIRFQKIIQFERSADALAEASFDAARIDPPIHLKAVGGQARVEPVAHVAVFGAAIGVADRAEFCDVEVGVAAEQWIVRPRDVIEPLMANHLPLRALQREADARIAVTGQDAHHVRAVFRARTVRRGIETREAEDKSDEFFVEVRAEKQSAVVDRGDEHMRGNHVGLAAGPDFALQGFDGGHLFRGFDEFDVERLHKF